MICRMILNTPAIPGQGLCCVVIYSLHGCRLINVINVMVSMITNVINLHAHTHTYTYCWSTGDTHHPNVNLYVVYGHVTDILALADNANNK